MLYGGDGLYPGIDAGKRFSLLRRASPLNSNGLQSRKKPPLYLTDWLREQSENERRRSRKVSTTRETNA